MNKAMLIGRLTKDPELRYTKENRPVCTFTVAIDSPSKNGEKWTDFPMVTVFGSVAENCAKFIGKGSMVGVEGKITTDRYQKEDGTMVYTTGVTASRVEFLTFKERQDQTRPNETKQDQSVPPWDSGQVQSQQQNDTTPWEQGQQQSYMPGNKGYQGWNGK